MKYIEVDEDLYRHIASKTERIGESASDILRRLLGLTVDAATIDTKYQETPVPISQPSLEHTTTVERHQVDTQHVYDFSTLINEHLLAQQKGAVGRFLFMLESLYQVAGEDFVQVLQIQGRDRLYFATSKAALLDASQSANPKEIGTSGYWVTSNNNTAKKQAILAEVFIQFGCDAELAHSLSLKV